MRDYRTAQNVVLSLRDVSLGCKAESPILPQINIDAKRGSRVAAIAGPPDVVHPWFSKDSINVQGETQQDSGQRVAGPSATFAYCSQTPWLDSVPA